MRRGYSAEGSLAQLTRDFGVFGPLNAEADPEPWLVAELDQHSAAIRESICADGARMTHRTLTHYLFGFMDGCRERGWYSSSDEYDWETLRLLAICRLAREYGFVR